MVRMSKPQNINNSKAIILTKELTLLISTEKIETMGFLYEVKRIMMHD